MNKCRNSLFKFIFISICFVLLSAFSVNQGDAGYDIIVVAGQSNANGGGIGAYDGGPKDRDPYIFQIGRSKSYNMKIIPAADVLQHWHYSPEDKRIGFAMAFAREYARSLMKGRRVLIVLAAQGGSSILDWDPDGKTSCNFGSLKLYADMKSRIDLALAAPGSNRIVAFLWQQGEKDINLASSRNKCSSGAGIAGPEDYGQLLQAFFKRFRKDYAPYGEFPIIIGAPVPGWLKGTTQWAVKEKFITVMKAVPSHVAHTGFVSADGLTSNYEEGTGPDSIHFSARSQVILGKRYAEMYRVMAKKISEVHP